MIVNDCWVPELTTFPKHSVKLFPGNFRQLWQYLALAQGNAYKPAKEPINYRGPSGNWTRHLQTEAPPPVSSYPARSFHITDIVSRKKIIYICSTRPQLVEYSFHAFHLICQLLLFICVCFFHGWSKNVETECQSAFELQHRSNSASIKSE